MFCADCKEDWEHIYLLEQMGGCVNEKSINSLLKTLLAMQKFNFVH